MEKQINFLILLAFSFITVGCAGNSKKGDKLVIESQTTETSKMKKYPIKLPPDLLPYREAIERRFETQNLWLDITMDEEAVDSPENPVLTEEDFFLGGIIKFSTLKKRGFTPINSQEFATKVRQFFNIDLRKQDGCKYLFPKEDYSIYVTQKHIGEYEEVRLRAADDPYRFNIYFFQTNNHIAFGMPLLLSSYEINKKDTIEFTSWDDELHRNKFLLNDSQSSLTWLINNDLEFLEELVREFGYDKNDRINKAVLEKNNAAYQEYEKFRSSVNKRKSTEILTDLFAKKDCYGNLQIREGLMKFISETYDKQYGTPNSMMVDCAIIMRIFTSEDYPEITSQFTKQERLKIAAYAGYYDYRERIKFDAVDEWREGWDGGFLRNGLSKELSEEIVRNNYYDLPDFKKFYGYVQECIERDYEIYKMSHPDVESEEQDGAEEDGE